MSLKWLGAILIVCGCGGIGFAMANAYRGEERELRRLAAALDYMSCELQYHLTPLPDLCRQSAAEVSGTTGAVLTALSVELENQILPDVGSCIALALSHSKNIPSCLHDAFALLGRSLGRFDLEGQLTGIQSVREYCRRQLESMAEGRESRLRSYQTLGLCAGAALAVLLV